MKTIQKRLRHALVLSLVLAMAAFAGPAGVYANTLAEEASDPTVLPSDLSNQQAGSAVVKAPLENDQLLVTVNGMDIALNISENTLVIDSKTGLQASLTGLDVNDSIYVYYSLAMTKSLPPQSHAIAIVTQVESNQSHAELFTVREIISREDGVIRALNKEGNLIVAFEKDMPLKSYQPGETASIEDIHVGTQLFIWYEIVALSYPGQTGATKAVLVGQEEGLGVRAVYTPMAGPNAAAVTIQGKPVVLNGKKLMNQEGLLMLPLRTVAENLGFRVTWNGAERSVLLDDGTVKTTLFIGQDGFFKASSQAIGLTQNFSLGAPPMLIDSTTYAPASLFNLLYSDNSAVKIEMKESTI